MATRGSFNLRAGRYRIKTKVWSSAADVPEFALFVYRSVSGVDTLEWIAGASTPSPIARRRTNDPLGTGDTVNTRVIEFDEIISHAVTTHYTQILVAEASNGNGVEDEDTTSVFLHRN